MVRVATDWPWLPLGIASGLVMFVVLDEAVNWAFGFTAPPDRFPMWAHVRGLVGHLAYGVAVAAVVEVLLAVLRLA